MLVGYSTEEKALIQRARIECKLLGYNQEEEEEKHNTQEAKHKADKKAWQEKHKEKLKAYNAEYYKKNKARLNAMRVEQRRSK